LSQNVRKKVFIRKIFSPNCSIGRVKCSFDNARRSQTECRKVLRQCPERIKTLFFFKQFYFFFYAFCGKQNAVLTTRRKVTASRPKKITQFPKINFKKNIFDEKTFPQNVISDSAGRKLFDDPGENFYRRLITFAQFLKRKKKNISPQLTIFAENVAMDT